MGLGFFGLTSNDLNQVGEVKISIYKQIHQICFHGKGGYSWPVVYNMPIYLRRFIFSEIKQFYEEEKEAAKQQPNGNNQITPGPSKNTSKNIPKSPPKSTTTNVPVSVKYK